MAPQIFHYVNWVQVGGSHCLSHQLVELMNIVHKVARVYHACTANNCYAGVILSSPLPHHHYHHLKVA